jgi:hypothetical protein
MQCWPHGQVVKTPPFHGGNRGSNPLGVINRSLKPEAKGQNLVSSPRGNMRYSGNWYPASGLRNGRLAQLGEHLPYKQGVGGSIPSAPTMYFFKLYLRDFEISFQSHHRGVEQLVARRAHNPKVAGSSPVPATITETSSQRPKARINIRKSFVFFGFYVFF